jgi:hypothetical protein
VRAVEQLLAAGLFQGFGLDPPDVHAQPVLEAAVIQRLVQALVRILVTDVLADDVDRDFVRGVPDAIDEIHPGAHARLGLRKVQALQHDAVESLGGEHQRHLVDARHVFRGDDGLFVDVAEEGDLPLDLLIEESVRAAQQDVGLNTDRPQVADAVLRRLRLQFSGGADEGDQGEVDVQRVLAPDVLPQLADGFDERQTFDVADGSPDLHEDDVDVVRDRANAVLDFVGDVRDDLDRPAEVIAAALLLDDRQVDLSGRPVVVARGGLVGEALVVAEVEVGLGAVVGDVHLAVLVRAHRPRIDVDVRVELLQRDLVAVPLEQRPD